MSNVAGLLIILRTHGKMMSKALAAQNDDQRHLCRVLTYYSRMFTEYAIRNTQYATHLSSAVGYLESYVGRNTQHTCPAQSDT